MAARQPASRGAHRIVPFAATTSVEKYHAFNTYQNFKARSCYSMLARSMVHLDRGLMTNRRRRVVANDLLAGERRPATKAQRQQNRGIFRMRNAFRLTIFSRHHNFFRPYTQQSLSAAPNTFLCSLPSSRTHVTLELPLPRANMRTRCFRLYPRFLGTQSLGSK